MSPPSFPDSEPPVVVPAHLAAALRQFAEYVAPITTFFQSEGWQRFVDGVRRMLEHPVWGEVAELAARAHALPPNLEGIRPLALVGMKSLAEEGITLYAVPRSATARRLLLAETPQARRRVLGECFNSILDDCEEQLAGCSKLELAPYARIATRAIAAAKDGHAEAAQALAANVVDTLLVQRYGWTRSRALTSHTKTTSDDLWSQLAVAEYMVIAPIYASYMAYWPGKGQPVPHRFARHVTTHHALPRQFSRRNAAQVLMQATSLIVLFAGELRAGDSATPVESAWHTDRPSRGPVASAD